MDTDTLLTTEIIIRPAQETDLWPCVELMYALQDMTNFHDYPQPDPAMVLAWLTQLGYCLVAVDQERIIGLCGGSVTYSSLFPDVPFVKEQALYVLPAYRRRGIGRRLFAGLAEYARFMQAQAIVRGKPHRRGEHLKWIPLGNIERDQS